MIDKEAIEKHIRGILIALGDNPDREGLIETPKRVANMYEEIFQGMNYTNDEIIKIYNKNFEVSNNLDSNDMVIVKDIEIFSCCEHHLALMYDMSVTVAYIPKDRVIGLSKIARICDMVGKRLQLQERIGRDIAYIVSKIINSEDIAVLIKGKHSCMTARGINKTNSFTETSTFMGEFKKNYVLQNRLFNRL
ncbi:MAG: GTP cyclohydrolase I FolE [Fusobacterium mortiferum]|jgi:GTP cyclohydrolase I|uniref:GTP cyclohydrolase 1 n=2 Tax=Fusobacterium mortiferum TaxID=850 RepID=A0A414PUY1_FUSMR|nr:MULTISPECIES: GTP cyclohydrolase I FolE [Fusobacterium]AVQ19325.1 GTP cyclohydrolase I FolE [Fusobacterium mortiferum ATCC 9817]EEO36267.1 GTP cyclohydrolase I [Fusobacterium mortiferum ATCC 9817]MDD7261242.1 GTP cyclohydrolase I FolE [Fusobacterium mortiferum]MDY4801817.1 GTP cyclohydrolase I FolE [Fusobacterium mortiferum]MDY5981149.1 GTP cyclohydrolase I FolE [Fusobacterium mortiferum]